MRNLRIFAAYRDDVTTLASSGKNFRSSQRNSKKETGSYHLPNSKRSSMSSTHKRALFAISSLGLGHATRSLTVINDFLTHNWFITIVCTGNALEFLKRELYGHLDVDFQEMADYPPLERGQGLAFYGYLILDLLRTWKCMHQEHRHVKEIEAGYDFIYSDGRYGFCSNTRPCAILTHQIDFMPPKFLRRFARLTERINLRALRHFDTLLIPDFPDPRHNLSGQLSHSRHLATLNHQFIGILSSYQHIRCQQDIDYLFVISGYLFEHKESFLATLLHQATQLKGHKVFILGQTRDMTRDAAALAEHSITIYAMVEGAQRQELFNRAKHIITRAGYTTIMDLVEHDKTGLLIPTPNQTEQEYLGHFLAAKGHFASVLQTNDIDINAALQKDTTNSGFLAPWKTQTSLQKLRDALSPLLHQRFFSIIVPAYNEEELITATLNALCTQHYPTDKYEIIVVENGSTDATLQIALDIAKNHPEITITVTRSAKGVSKAKNHGLHLMAAISEFVVFCDADTQLHPDFLRQFNHALAKADATISVGTCSIRPHEPSSRSAAFWFGLYDVTHRLTKTSFSLQFASADVARHVDFDEQLQFAEDLLFIKKCRRFGKFLFFGTDQVRTSARRFEATGYFKLTCRWIYEALLPLSMKKQRRYHVIR